jgi:hypothetical protein
MTDTADISEYRLVGGKFVGCRLRDLSPEDLEGYGFYRPYVAEDLSMIRAYARLHRAQRPQRTPRTFAGFAA